VTAAIVHPDGTLILGDRQWRAALGRAGVRIHKQEGDEATPAGLLELRRVLYRADRVAMPRASVRREPIAEADGWCDDPYDAAYNTMIRLPQSCRHERLWRDDGLYDIVGVLGWNDAPVQRHAGSAIFLHVARKDLAPTDGCIALPLNDLQALLATGVTAFRVLPQA
jgi:L,D-peptidoglycan transpeptidase YkuD (ErfK/YbiS/YcfS/YnhG family)